MTVKTASGKTFNAHRCYINDFGKLVIALIDTDYSVLPVFVDSSEMSIVYCHDEENPVGEQDTEFEGYTKMDAFATESGINGIVMHFAKQ